MMNSSPKTIYIIYSGFFLRGSGVSQHIRQLQKALQRIGFRVVILSLEKLPFCLRYLPHIIQKIVNSVYSPWGYYYRFRFCRLIYRWLFAREIQATQMSSVIFEDIFITFPVKVNALAIIHALQSDNIQHHIVSKKRMERIKKLEARIIDRVNIPIVTVSERYKQSIIRDLSPFADVISKIGVIHLGVDINGYIRDRKKLENDGLLKLVFVGNLEARKNVVFLIDVIKTFMNRFDDKIHLHIIGSGPNEKSLELKVRAEELIPYITFEGRKTHNQVADMLGNYHILLLPSLKESFSYTLLEAKLSGLKTIVNECLDVPDEFCDIRLDLDVQKWAHHIDLLRTQLRSTNSDSESYIIQGLAMKYNSDRMVRDILHYLQS